MEDCMRECSRKLALWHTRTFRPLLIHEELDPILATKGFVGLPPYSAVAGDSKLVWKEYVHSAAGTKSVVVSQEAEIPLPRPRLPFQRIDGLHICTYRAFIEAVNFYLEMDDISTLFHVRGMPLHRIHDTSVRWIPMEKDESISVFLYRDGTLDQTTEISSSFYNSNSDKQKQLGNGNKSNLSNSMIIRERGNKIYNDCIVSLKDIIVV